MSASYRPERFTERIKDYSREQFIGTVLNLFSRTSDRTMIKAVSFLERMSADEYKGMVRAVREAFETSHPSIHLARRVFKEMNSNCKKKLLVNFVVEGLFHRPKRMASYIEEYGLEPPFVGLISPTMRCNLRCVGCYAANYTMASDLEPEIVDRVIQESKDIGLQFMVILGGEPFVYKPLWDILEKHNDIIFQIYTNGTVIDEQAARRIAQWGNIVPAISIDGFEEEMDSRRGKGTFAAVMRAMDLLRAQGVPFCFSCCSTRQNCKVIVSDEFIDLMIDKGAVLGWYFNYMPIGRDPDLELMPTPEQRDHVRARVNYLRETKPILLVDFFGDGPLVEGCLAGGKTYFHINNRGDVEPCIFAHYAVDNIKKKSLKEALNSDFFKGIRSKQPFGYVDIRPCPLIDYPGAMASLVRRYEARPTHEGAEKLVGELVPQLHGYARRLAEIYEKVWDEEYQWAKRYNASPKRKREKQLEAVEREKAQMCPLT